MKKPAIPTGVLVLAIAAAVIIFAFFSGIKVRNRSINLFSGRPINRIIPNLKLSRHASAIMSVMTANANRTSRTGRRRIFPIIDRLTDRQPQAVQLWGTSNPMNEILIPAIVIVVARLGFRMYVYTTKKGFQRNRRKPLFFRW